MDSSTQVYQSADLRSRAVWAGGLVVAVIVGFSLFTASLERRIGMWAMAIAVIAYYLLMAFSRVEVTGSDVLVVNYGRRHRLERKDVLECGVDTRPLIGPVGRLRLRDGSMVYLYGLQPRRRAGDDTLRSDELSALALALSAGGPLNPS